ncbi:matrix-remodeling-associated protein 7 isoform X2 [Marmota monax]|uniref:matrix-remodeling-associated protein 7 isoform X2 n=1 Tax=Marmota monax TaxID=9995 RepID=UPI0026F28830|nr:matrix-remodeling-associated protein 7 isoform X2 [Marmota monax]
MPPAFSVWERPGAEEAELHFWESGHGDGQAQKVAWRAGPAISQAAAPRPCPGLASVALVPLICSLPWGMGGPRPTQQNGLRIPRQAPGEGQGPEEEEQDSDSEKDPPPAGPEDEDGETFSFKYSPGQLRGNQYKKMMTKEELEEEQRVQKEQLAAIFKLMKDNKETFGWGGLYREGDPHQKELGRCQVILWEPCLGHQGERLVPGEVNVGDDGRAVVAAWRPGVLLLTPLAGTRAAVEQLSYGGHAKEWPKALGFFIC